jgi:hypothetical protein
MVMQRVSLVEASGYLDLHPIICLQRQLHPTRKERNGLFRRKMKMNWRNVRQ